MFRRTSAWVLACLLFVAALPLSSESAAASPDLVISQIYGGGSNSGAPYTHDYIEIFNRGGAPVALGGYSLQYASATGTGALGGNSGQLTELPSVTLAPGRYFLVQQSGGTVGASLPAPDHIDPTPTNMSSSAGKVALVSGTTGLGCNGGNLPCDAAQKARIVDLVGYGNANFYEGGAQAPGLSNSTAGFRAGAGCTDTDSNDADFTAGAPAPRNSATAPNFCAGEAAPSVASTSPAAGATGVATNATVTVTFSEAVTVTEPWFAISCSAGGAKPATASGGPSAYTLTPATPFAHGETCTVTVTAAAVTDQDALDPPDTMAADHIFSFTVVEADPCTLPATRIHAVQGSGAATTMSGATVTVQAVVVGDYQGTGELGGYFLQEEDADADGDAATSEGLFVFNTSFAVAVGDVVRITGKAGEFSGQTQLSGVTSRIVCATGASVTAAAVSLPVAALDDLERYEGMLVTFAQTLTVTETFTLGRFGEVRLSANGRLYNPTAVTAPGAAALARADLNRRSSILLDDGNGQQNADPTARGLYPAGGLSASNTLRSGYTTSGLTGVLDYRFSQYRVQALGPVAFSAANPRAAAPAASGNTTVASFNVLNYFNGDGQGGGFPTPRGATTAAELERQRAKIVSAIVALDADVVGLMELENDAGPDSAIAELVAALNAAAGAGTYAHIDTGVIGTDAIRVALIYQPASVTPLGAHAVLDASVDARFDSTRNRPALAQTFQRTATGAKFTVAVNHLKSKGSACTDAGDPDAGDGQGNCNLTRTSAAAALADWLATDPTASGDPDVLVIGDLNAYTFEDPIRTLESKGYTNLIRSHQGDAAYSYVFNGEAGYLDHALANASLASQVTGVAEWHINADEPIVLDYNLEFKSAGHQTSLYAPGPYRSSDHDPVVVSLDLRDTVKPTIAFTGNAGTYTVDQDVAIACVATDDWSGIASSTCEGGSGPAWSFGVGTHTVTATATDGAGNTATATTTFDVTVTYDSLCALTKRFATRPLAATGLCVQLEAAERASARGLDRTADVLLRAYGREVTLLVRAGVFTAADAATLASLAEALAAAN